MDADVEQIFIEDGQVYVCTIGADNRTYTVELTDELAQELGTTYTEVLDVLTQEPAAYTSESVVQKVPKPSPSQTRAAGRKVWTRHETFALLASYKSKQDLMRSTHFRNDAIWEEISSDIHCKGFRITAAQCKFKFYNLKKAFLKAQGAADQYFPYEREFEEILESN